MKKWFASIAIFLSSYIVFLIASLPLTVIVNNLSLPSTVNLESVSGTVWNGEIQRVTISANTLEEVKLSLSFWSLFTLSPSLDVEFGDAMLAGPEGELNLEVSSSEITISDATVMMSAGEIANMLPLPIPLSAQGNVDISLSTLSLNISEKLTCLEGQGNVAWTRAGVIAMDQNIKLGKLAVGVSCENGNVLAKVDPKNDLGLSYDAVLALPSKKASGEGYLKPGAKFPKELKSALSFLGRADKEGRYRLNF